MMSLTGLPRRLVEQGLIELHAAEDILKSAKSDKRSFVTVAVQKDPSLAGTISRIASEEFGLPVLDLSSFDFDVVPSDVVSLSLIEKHRILPLFTRGNRLFVAQSDPSLIHAIDEIKFNTGMTTESILVEEDKLAIAVDKLINASDTSLEDAFGDLDGALDDVDLEDPEARDKEQEKHAQKGNP